MDERVLGIILRAKDEASDTIEGVGKKAGGVSEILGKSFKDAAIVSGVALAGLVGVAVTSVDAFNENQKAVSQLDAVLQSTHGSAGLYKQDILDQAEAMQQLTTYSHNQVLEAQNLMLTFTEVKGAIYQQSIPAILDMSTALGEDLKSSSIQLGKALNDPINGITALKRVGVDFSDSQKNVIKSLVDTGQTAKAQQIIINEIEREFGGSAAAAANTFSGKMTQLKNDVDDLKESFGELIVNALEPVISHITPVVNEIMNWVKGYGSLNAVQASLTKNLGGFGTFLGQLIGFFAQNRAALIALGGAFAGVLAISIIAAVAAMASFIAVSLPVLAIFAAVGAGVALVVTHWQSFEPVINAVTPILQYFMQNLAQFWTVIQPKLIAALQAIEQSIKTTWENNKTLIMAVLAIIVTGLIVAFEAMKATIAIVLDVISGNWKGVWQDILAFFTGIWNDINAVSGNMLNNMLAGVEHFVGSIIAKFEAMASGIMNALHAIKFPHLSMGSGDIKVAGHDIQYPTFNVDWYENGGFVPSTGLAMVHANEFVLSNAMLQGRQQVPSQVQQAISKYSQPITINANIGSDMDINELGYKLAFILRNSR